MSYTIGEEPWWSSSQPTLSATFRCGFALILLLTRFSVTIRCLFQ